MDGRRLGWVEWTLIAVVAMIAFRFFFVARIAIILGLSALVVGIFGYVLYQRLQNRRKMNSGLEKSLAAIRDRMDYCEDELAKIKTEAKEIEQNIQDLHQRKAKTGDLTPSNREDTDRLLAAFKSELQIRRKKQTFFETCLRKLRKLYNNQELAITLAEKEERLRQLQEGHYEDLAEMEALRSDMELDVFYLDTIESLSEKMLLTSTTDEADALQLELEKMTRELDEL